MASQNIQQSVVTPLIKQAVKLHHYTFGFLYPNIFKISVGPNGFILLESVPFSCKLAPWILSMGLITGLCGLGSSLFICLLQTTNYERKPWLEWSSFKTLISIGLAFAASVEIICCFVIYRQAVIGKGFSELLHLEHRCINSIHPIQKAAVKCESTQSRQEVFQNEFKLIRKRTTPQLRKTQRTKKPDHLGCLLNIMVIFGPPFAIPFVILSVLTQLDPFYFIFEQFVLPHPYYRSMEIIVFVPLFRMVLVFFCTIEFLRFGTIAIIVLVVTVYIILSVAHKLEHAFYDECLLLYVQLRLIFASVNSLLASLIGILIFGGAFGTILVLWIVFKCYNLLSIYIYAAVCVVSIVFVLTAAVLLPSGIKVRSGTKELLRNKMSLHYCTDHQSRKKYYYYNLWKSQQCVGFRCASFFLVKEGLTMSYLQEVVNNLVNAVLLIEA